ncbi:MAG TPA: hypothetical protein VNG71_00915 [Pyrinomonadaceae bacterium]|nr:hypothetical protein [Pyrinomonadaceae bacterium]
MSRSRRKFLKLGALATLFAAVPFKTLLAQGWKDRDGNPANTPPVQADSLANYTEATFRSYLNSVFALHTTQGIVGVTLLQIDDMTASKGGECFTLLFRGGARAQRQDTYTLVHPALGTFQLLLVPTGPDQNGAQGYVATINRLSLADAATMAPPTKQAGKSQPATAPPAPATATPPAVTPSVTPSTQPTAPVVSPSAPAPKKPQPSKGRKPSWKGMAENPILDNEWLNL